MAESASADPCELTFAEGLPLGDAAEVALEDYARVLTAAAGAEAVRSQGDSSSKVTGVRLLGKTGRPSPQARRDIEDFARGLAAQDGGSGLGWA